jgi:hypothetical protein
MSAEVIYTRVGGSQSGDGFLLAPNTILHRLRPEMVTLHSRGSAEDIQLGKKLVEATRFERAPTVLQTGALPN